MRYNMVSALLLMTTLVLSACGSDEPETSAASSTTGTLPQDSMAPAGACNDATSCQLTKDSGVYGIPIPADSNQTAEFFYLTNIGELEVLGRVYYDVLTGSGWTMVPEMSELDPAKSDGLSYGVYQRCEDTLQEVYILIAEDEGASDALKLSVQKGMFADEFCT